MDAASWLTAHEHVSVIGMTGQSFLNMLNQGAAPFQQIALLVQLLHWVLANDMLLLDGLMCLSLADSQNPPCLGLRS